MPICGLYSIVEPSLQNLTIDAFRIISSPESIPFDWDIVFRQICI